jgi:hypothetical protein
MAILPVGISGEAGAYQIERSLRFNSADSASLSRTPASASNRKTWTWSGWVKRCEISDTERVFFSAGTDGNNFTALEWIDSKLYLQNYTSGTQTITNTTAVYRDASAWYHIVLAIDTTQATAANRAKIYVNGVQQAGFSGTPFSQDQQFWINYTYTHRIGARQLSSPDAYSSQYMAEVHFIDGSALTPSSFGETDSDTGVWKPKAYSGSYGTNGFYLDFGDNSSTTALGYDAAGSNDWTPNNFSVTAGAGNDSLVDSPTRYGTDTGVGGEVRGNYATLNPLDSTSNITLSNGNLDFSQGNTTDNTVRSTVGMSSGKWYCEVTVGSSNKAVVGIAKQNATLTNYLGSDANGWGYYTLNGNKYNNGTGTSYGATYGTGDVIGIAFDADNGTLTFYKNGSSQGQAFSGLTSGPYFFAHGVNNANGSFNFGQRPFAYTAPSGFKALCTTNLPEPTIAEGGEYFNAVLYTGNGGTQSVTGVGFQPDFVWIKNRQTTNPHKLVDAVRGAGISLSSNSTDAEGNESAYFTAFASDGFDLALGGGGYNAAYNYVAWNWKANGAGSSNTAGTISSTVSANTTAGFSVVTYTGTGSNATIGHGLGATPAFFVTKQRSGAENWIVYHKNQNASPASGHLMLQSTAAFTSSSTVFNNTAPTSTVFSVGTAGGTNESGQTFVAYCFAPIAGYSAFGSYTGNGSTDGPFVFTGFRPAFVLIKCSSTTGNWIIWDSVRGTYNVIDSLRLYPNLSDAEGGGSDIDFLSNGFKFRNTNAAMNGSGSTYVYACFAENPMKLSLAR